MIINHSWKELNPIFIDDMLVIDIYISGCMDLRFRMLWTRATSAWRCRVSAIFLRNSSVKADHFWVAHMNMSDEDRDVDVESDVCYCSYIWNLKRFNRGSIFWEICRLVVLLTTMSEQSMLITCALTTSCWHQIVSLHFSNILLPHIVYLWL